MPSWKDLRDKMEKRTQDSWDTNQDWEITEGRKVQWNWEKEGGAVVGDCIWTEHGCVSCYYFSFRSYFIIGLFVSLMFRFLSHLYVLETDVPQRYSWQRFSPRFGDFLFSQLAVSFAVSSTKPSICSQGWPWITDPAASESQLLGLHLAQQPWFPTSNTTEQC